MITGRCLDNICNVPKRLGKYIIRAAVPSSGGWTVVELDVDLGGLESSGDWLGEFGDGGCCLGDWMAELDWSLV